MSTRIFLSGLRFDVRAEDLAERFGLPLEAVRVGRDRQRDRFLGYGFINLPDDSARALLALGSFPWRGRAVSAQVANPDPRARSEATRTAQPATSETTESTSADWGTIRAGKFEGCAIPALNRDDLREARCHLGVSDPSRQRIDVELLRRRRVAMARRQAAARRGAGHPR